MTDEAIQPTAIEPVQATTEPQPTPVVESPVALPVEVASSNTADPASAPVPPEVSESFTSIPDPVPAETPTSIPKPQSQSVPSSAEPSTNEVVQEPAQQTPVTTSEPVSQQAAPTADQVTQTNNPVPSQANLSSAEKLNTIRSKAHAARGVRIQNKLDKIMALVTEKKTIRNNDIEMLLHVADATATRHLSALVKQGKLKKVGNRGSAHYELP